MVYYDLLFVGYSPLVFPLNYPSELLPTHFLHFSTFILNLPERVVGMREVYSSFGAVGLFFLYFFFKSIRLSPEGACWTIGHVMPKDA